jgi:hypothetical protein
VVLLRFVLKSLLLFQSRQKEEAGEFTCTGIARLSKAFNFTDKQHGKLGEQLQKEYRGWSLFYDILDFIEAKPALLHQTRQRFEIIVKNCQI